jgi:hypothetical protein
MITVLDPLPPAGGAGNGDHERAIRAHLEQGDTRLLERVRRENRIYLHNYAASVDAEFECDLAGCGSRFAVRLVPGQIIYPRYCPAHRTPHRRSLSAPVASR